jgi:hypothetical protein
MSLDFTLKIQSGSLRAPSHKLQAASYKLQATSFKRQREGQATSAERAPNYCL